MFSNLTEKTIKAQSSRLETDTDNRNADRRDRAIRFMDMQNVVGAGLAGPQQSVNNAENYPSTWTTNPDGGANGQV